MLENKMKVLFNLVRLLGILINLDFYCLADSQLLYAYKYIFL